MQQADAVANLAALAKRDAKQSRTGIAWRDAPAPAQAAPALSYTGAHR
jgi:hypothetical protein